VLGDAEVSAVLEAKWLSEKARYPQITKKKDTEWSNRLWGVWVREKKKTATRKITEVRRKVKQIDRKPALFKSEDSSAPAPPTSDITATMTPRKHIMSSKQTTGPQLQPPSNKTNNDDDSSMSDISPETPSSGQRIKSPLESSMIAPLLPPDPITSKFTPLGGSDYSPSSESSSLTPRKRRHQEMLALSSGHSHRVSRSEFAGNSDIECFLAKQLKDNLIRGCLSRNAILKVLEEFEISEYLKSDETMSMDDIVGTAALEN